MNLFTFLIEKHLPKIFVESERLKAFLRVLLTPFQFLSDAFDVFVSKIRNKLRFDGRVIYLEHALNDAFDPIQRRIHIDDSTVSNTTPSVLFRKTEGQPSIVLYRKNEAQSSVVLYRNSEISTLDFTVFVPASIYNAISHTLITALVDFYKCAGKRFDIKIF
jgi:hypothetical protein